MLIHTMSVPDGKLSSLGPYGEPETVRQLVKREVEDIIALHKAELDLEYRIKRHKELSARYRARRSEEAEVKRQMEALNLPPRLLRQMKEG